MVGVTPGEPAVMGPGGIPSRSPPSRGCVHCVADSLRQDWRSSTQRQAAVVRLLPRRPPRWELADRLPAAVPAANTPGRLARSPPPGYGSSSLRPAGSRSVRARFLTLLAHGDKQGVHIQLPFLPGGPVPHPQAGEAASRGEELLHGGVHPAADILPAFHLVHQIARRIKPVPVDQE